MRVRDQKACEGCPLRGSGEQAFVPDQLKEGALLHLVAQTPDELKQSFPKVEKQYLPLAGVRADQVSLSCAVRCTADLPAPVTPAQFDAGKRGVLENAIGFCDRAHSRVRGGGSLGLLQNCKLVITQGDLALYAATGQLRSAHEWRGYIVPYKPLSDSWMNSVWMPGQKDLPVLVTLRLADLFGLPQLAYPTMADWRKGRWFLEGKWPKKPPEVITTPDARMFTSPAAWDTEWNPATGQFLRFSVATGEGRVYAVEMSDHIVPRLQYIYKQKGQALPTVRPESLENPQTNLSGLRGVVKDAQSESEAMQGLLRQKSVRPDGSLSFRAGELLQRDVQEVLREHARTESPSVISSAVKTIQPCRGATFRHGGSAGWQVCSLPESVWRENRDDRECRSLPRNGDGSGFVVPPLQCSVGASGGQFGDDQSASEVQRTVVIGQNIIVDLPNLSRVFSVGSVIEVHDGMLAHSVLWSDLPHSLDFLASIYSPINRHKHLYNRSPIQYAGMDAYVQLKVWEALAQELEKDPQSKAIYEEEMIPLWPIILESQEAGLKLDQDRVREALEWHQAQQEAVVKEAQALCGYPILLSSPEQVSTWLYEVEKLGVKRRGKRGA